VPRATRCARDGIVLRVVIVNGLAAILFMIGYALFGIAMIRSATLPRWSGVLVAVGAPAHLLGFGIAQLVSTAAWAFAIFGSVSLGAGLAWPGYRLWHAPFTRGPEDSRAKELCRPWIRRLHDLRHLVESALESLWLPRGPSATVRDCADYLRLEAIAHSRLGDEVARPSRIILQLASQCLDVLA
jgi:hypothetical protein